MSITKPPRPPPPKWRHLYAITRFTAISPPRHHRGTRAECRRTRLFMAANELRERRLQTPRHRSGRPIADLSLVDRRYPDHLRGGAGHEALVSAVKVEADEVLLEAVDPLAAAQPHDHVPRNPLQDAGLGGRGHDHAVLHDENVVGGAFGDVAEVIEQDRLHAAGVDGLDLGEDAVEVVEALDARGRGVGVVLDDAGGDDRE